MPPREALNNMADSKRGRLTRLLGSSSSFVFPWPSTDQLQTDVLAWLTCAKAYPPSRQAPLLHRYVLRSTITVYISPLSKIQPSLTDGVAMTCEIPPLSFSILCRNASASFPGIERLIIYEQRILPLQLHHLRTLGLRAGRTTRQPKSHPLYL